ncbi:hypothetical protein G7Y89_g3368 [Cudoniella acicularis]|uniref:Pre-mRNA-splicing factor n=1 Tax=Cudoniella acicularis TaxID=354080 RepID=A0A8H4RUH5_9HELO|nr:hypothetical protein G7Y89_g3368 [Cudoniella acicularis]
MSPSKDDPPASGSGSSAPKIAIKGFSLSAKGKAPSSTSSSAKAKHLPPSYLGKRSRPKLHHGDSDSEDEGAHARRREEVVTGFGEGGAIRHDDERANGKEQKKELREREAAQKESREGKKEGVNAVNGGDEEISWGLSVRKRVKVEDPEKDTSNAPTDDTSQMKTEPEPEEKPKTADEEALAALLGEKKEKKGPDLVIPTLNAPPEERISEEAAFKRAVASAPDASTLEDYERVPVEEFGAALLRGMGWKGEKVGKVRDVKRRQNLLGLGAKELKDAEELGAWVQKSDVKRLNERRGGGYGGGSRDRRPKVAEYKREKERRDEKGGGEL